MSSVPDPDAAARQRRKDDLEIQKLEVQLQREAKNAAQTDDLAIRKLEHEIEDIRRRWPWQRAQYLVIMAGVAVSAVSLSLSYCTYQKAVREERQQGLQSAVEHLQNGWPSGAVELAQYEPEGFQVLVKSVDATNSTVQKSWPVVTLAALDELHRYGRLSNEQKADLAKAMTANDVRIGELLVQAASEPEKQGPAYDGLVASIKNHYCVQTSLQRVLGTTPTDWPKTKVDVLGIIGAEPNC
jgi:hypothetical protein